MTDVSLVIGRVGPGRAEAVCRIAFAGLLRRYGDVDGAAQDLAGTAPTPALRLELTSADDRIAGMIVLTGPDLAAVLPSAARTTRLCSRLRPARRTSWARSTW